MFFTNDPTPLLQHFILHCYGFFHVDARLLVTEMVSGRSSPGIRLIFFCTTFFITTASSSLHPQAYSAGQVHINLERQNIL